MVKNEIINALKEYIEAEKDLRSCPETWSSSPRRSAMYNTARQRFVRAEKNLWHVTDIEYDEDGFRNIVWEWRYWKVVARKCCYYQLRQDYKSSKYTMENLTTAEYNFVKVCRLENIWESPDQAIIKRFPELISHRPAIMTHEEIEKMMNDFLGENKCLNQPANSIIIKLGSWWKQILNWLGIIGR